MRDYAGALVNRLMREHDKQCMEANETPKERAQRDSRFHFDQRRRFSKEARELRKTGREQRALIRELRAEIERLNGGNDFGGHG